MVKLVMYEDDNIDCIYEIHIGENKKENWEIIDAADENDMWFHIDNLPSCHVILKCSEEKKPCKKVLKRCAYLCKIHTNSAKSLRKCNVIYTSVSHVQKTNTMGEVHATNCKTIQV
jgi:predicted ribosome quality control (RQC) complex YloA/Tae2 family protein